MREAKDLGRPLEVWVPRIDLPGYLKELVGTFCHGIPCRYSGEGTMLLCSQANSEPTLAFVASG
jgi:hypothetical protein